MNNQIIKIILIFFSISIIFANRLINIPITLTQPNGLIIDCYVSGDEYYQRLHDKNDYTIIQNQDGYYYYAKQISYNLI